MSRRDLARAVRRHVPALLYVGALAAALLGSVLSPWGFAPGF